MKPYGAKHRLLPVKIKTIIVFPLLAILIGCENDINTITSLSQVDSLPAEMTRNIQVIYSDSGRIQAMLESPLMKRYEQKDPYYEFPEGFRMIFYDSAMNPETEITAKYGIRNDKTKIMEAQNNVVVKSIIKSEQLDTEQLTWDEVKRQIYSDVFVKITRPDRVIYGDGLTSDQDFNNYTIKNLKGEFQVNPDER